ncbi:hypothetical protein NKJ71_19705 [Mesorhizobium sp. M0050]|uniref:hypothetical protein n=1 Tax=Mesorhizobium sp. M0050 TaxID=2956861 RepID=UPI003334AD21
MTHTEEEARELWCPQSRVLTHTSAQDGKGRTYEGGYAWNRAPNTFDRHDEDNPPYIPHAAGCVASKCMMWRWAQKPNPDWRPSGAMGTWPMQDHRNDPPMYLEDTTRGYCGLGGRP